MRIENTPDSEKEHPRSIASIRRANVSDGRGDGDDHGSAFAQRESHPTSIGSLCPRSSVEDASKIHLACSWRAILGQEVVHGQHCIRGITVAPRTFFGGCPISARAVHASRTEHDFSRAPATIVPVTLTLTNRMLATPVRFTWSWEPLGSPGSSPDLIGTCAETIELGPSQEVEIPLEFLVTEAGIHDLQNLRFVVHRGTDADPEGDETHCLSQQWLIHVADASSSSSLARRATVEAAVES